MSAATLTIISAGLQLIVPSYGLRLVRRFGPQSVGWFLVIAFSSLALLHLVSPFKLTDASLGQHVAFAVGSLLLLIGLGHVETLCSARKNEEMREKDLCGQWEERVQIETADLARSNQELKEAKARCEQRLKVLQESEARYRFLFNDNPQPMFLFDLRTFRLLLGNQAALKQYGYTAEEFQTLTLQHLLSAAAVAGVREYAAHPCSRVEPLRWQHQRRDHSLIEVEMLSLDLKYEGNPARLVLVNDIAFQMRREADVHNAARLETVANVAGGFAHHFNNLLAIIEGSASLLGTGTSPEKAPEFLKNISGAVARGAGLTKQLMVIGGRRPVHIAPVDLNGLLRNMNPLMRRLAGNQVSIQSVYSAGLPLAAIDSQVMEQVVINLVLNARDAMPRGGTITLNTSTVRRRDVPSVDARNHTGEFLRLSVRDTGVGMTPEVQAHLFEPFFTTKDIGQASGLGLAAILGAVKQQSGWVEYTTEVGKGTEFRIFIPCAPPRSVAAAQPQAPATVATVLLVEPDDRARSTARCVLSWNGFRVIEADSTATALMLWDSQAAIVDMILVDSTFSDGMSGRDLVSRLRQAKPNLKVVYTSAAPPAVGATEQKGDTCYVSKPYRSETLLEAVRSTIDDGANHQTV